MALSRFLLSFRSDFIYINRSFNQCLFDKECNQKELH